MRRRPRVGSDWVVERARRELDKALTGRRLVGERVQRFLIAAGWRRLVVIVLIFLALLAACIPLRNAGSEAWPSFASDDPSQTLQTLWQVQAALVALAFPFLLLLIQFSHDDGVTALRSSEVLTRETYVRTALEFSTAGLVASGVLSAWLASSGAVIVAVLLIMLPTAGVLLRSYVVALDLLFDRPLLRRKSIELLEEKLMSSMRDLWAVQRGNAVLIEQLAVFGLEHSYFEPEPDDDRWWSLAAPASGRIADISVGGLATVLGALPRTGIAAHLDPAAMTTTCEPEGSGGPAIRLLRLCGDRVKQGERVILLLRSAFALTSDPEVPLDRAFKIEPADD